MLPNDGYFYKGLTMTLTETIEKAVEVVGSQRALARLIGEREQHISDFKKGRPCSYQKHAEIAAVAGLEEEARRILLKGMANSLREDIPHEAQAKAGLLAMLKAFPNDRYENEQIKRLLLRALRLFRNVFTQYRVDTCPHLPAPLI